MSGEQVQVGAPSRITRHVAREDIAVRIAGSCIPTKHQSGSRTNLSPRKFGRAAKRSPLRKEMAKKKDHTKVGSFICKGCGSTLHPPEDCWTLHPELREKAKAKGRLGRRHN